MDQEKNRKKKKDRRLRVVYGLEWLPLGYMIEISIYHEFDNVFDIEDIWHPQDPSDEELDELMPFWSEAIAPYDNQDLAEARLQEWRGQ